MRVLMRGGSMKYMCSISSYISRYCLYTCIIHYLLYRYYVILGNPGVITIILKLIAFIRSSDMVRKVRYCLYIQDIIDIVYIDFI